MPIDPVVAEVRRALTEPEHMSDIDLIVELRRAASTYNSAYDRVIKECNELYSYYEKILSLVKKKQITIYSTQRVPNQTYTVGTLIKAPIPEIKIESIKI